MFSKRTIKPHTLVTSVDTASEALAVSLGEKATIDMDYMMELSGKSENEIFEDLKGVIFLNPLYEYGNSYEPKYLMADEYLSGNVREKLKIAKNSAELYPEDYNFYLKHKFDKTYSAYGCPYVQENCDVQKPSDNIIIYGHHMNDGSMFTGLMKYRNKSFWEEHKAITFDTLTDRHQYEVIAVFKTVVYTNSSDSFKYYEFTDAENAAEFDAYVAKCKELSLYDTGVSAEYGDKLISLSTCEYSRNNGRLVVVAKRVD